MKQVGDVIHHYGEFQSGTIEASEEVKLFINGVDRKMNARIHSAGHLLDVAMKRAGRTDLKPSKGYHFPDGPYVEYEGVVDEADRPALIESLTKHCNDLIEEAKAS